jgi:predicted nucleic acid-binding protein
MIVLLDTNVVSELSRPSPSPQVERFVRSVAPGHAWISAITLAELNLGIALMPEGRKKEQYEDRKIRTLKSFGGACAPFDALAAGVYASVVLARKKIGRPIGIADAQIAAIAVTAGLTLATRNTKDFEGIDGLKLTDPWN